MLTYHCGYVDNLGVKLCLLMIECRGVKAMQATNVGAVDFGNVHMSYFHSIMGKLVLD